MKGLQAEDGMLSLLKLKSLAHFQSIIESKVFYLPTLSTIELINYSTTVQQLRSLGFACKLSELFFTVVKELYG